MENNINQTQQNTQETNASDRDWLTTLLLLIFVGMFGVHQFYAGNTKNGVIYLVLSFCTCGIGSAIWWIFDLVALLTDKFTDAEGRVIQQKK